MPRRLGVDMSAAITRIEPRELSREFSNEQLYVIRDQIARDLDDGEFALFIEVCKRSKLDPFRKQIYAIKRRMKDGSYRVAHQTGIDGFRVIAERSGRYEGQLGPFWCGDDGVWKDAWLSKGNPSAARIGVPGACDSGFCGADAAPIMLSLPKHLWLWFKIICEPSFFRLSCRT